MKKYDGHIKKIFDKQDVEYNVDEGWNKLQFKLEGHKKKFTIYKFLAAACFFSVLFLGSYFIYLDNNNDNIKEIYSRNTVLNKAIYKRKIHIDTIVKNEIVATKSVDKKIYISKNIIKKKRDNDIKQTLNVLITSDQFIEPPIQIKPAPSFATNKNQVSEEKKKAEKPSVNIISAHEAEAMIFVYEEPHLAKTKKQNKAIKKIFKELPEQTSLVKVTTPTIIIPL